MDYRDARRYSELDDTRWTVGAVKSIMGDDVKIDQTALIYGARDMHICNGSYIGPYVYMRGKIVIGSLSWIGPFTQINGEGGVEIGKAVGIGNSVIILTCEHDQQDINKPISFGDLIKSPVRIGNGSNIGVGSIILPGVSIGNGAQIGAGSVVTKNTVVKDFEIWAGNPARKIDKWI